MKNKRILNLIHNRTLAYKIDDLAYFGYALDVLRRQFDRRVERFSSCAAAAAELIKNNALEFDHVQKVGALIESKDTDLLVTSKEVTPYLIEETAWNFVSERLNLFAEYNVYIMNKTSNNFRVHLMFACIVRNILSGIYGQCTSMDEELDITMELEYNRTGLRKSE
uniref:Uncharacterized protein n=1 Tax=Megaselia scalaris TaxID=36166 RepID=T1H0T1_MEGSC